VSGGNDAKGLGLFKIPVEGGAPVRLAGTGLNPVWSPNGDLIVYSGTDVGGKEPLLAVTPGGSPVDLPPIQISTSGERFRFTPDGKGLVYMQGGFGAQDFRLLNLATRQTRQLTHLTNPATMRTFDITADGKQIVFDRLRNNSDIVLI
jgi:Tol biopolymer transport system component